MRGKKGNKAKKIMLFGLSMLLTAGLFCGCGRSSEEDELNELKKELQDELGISDKDLKPAEKKGKASEDDELIEDIRIAAQIALASETVYEAVRPFEPFYITIDNEGTVAFDGLYAAEGGGKIFADELKGSLGSKLTVDGDTMKVNLVSGERTKEGSKCWIQAKYDERRQDFLVQYMDSTGTPTEEVTWDGIKASDES